MKMTSQRGDEVTVKPTRFLARGWLMRGATHSLIGDDGIGKSTLWALIAAHITTGRPFPAIGYDGGDPADVMAIVTEDGWSDVLYRVRSAGGDVARMHLFGPDRDDDDREGETPVIPGPDASDLAERLANLRDAGTPIALLVIDAWLDTVPGNLKVADIQQARRAMTPLKRMARKFDLSVLLVAHTNRLETGNTRNLYGGTATLRQVPRVAIFAAMSPDKLLFVGVDKIAMAGKREAIYFGLEQVQDRPESTDADGTVGVLAYRGRSAHTITDLVKMWFKEEQQGKGSPVGSSLGDVSLRVLACVARHPEGVRAGTVAAEVGIEEHQARTYLSRLAAGGHLDRPEPGLYVVARNSPSTVGCAVAPVAPVLHTPDDATLRNTRNGATETGQGVAPGLGEAEYEEAQAAKVQRRS